MRPTPKAATHHPGIADDDITLNVKRGRSFQPGQMNMHRVRRVSDRSRKSFTLARHRFSESPKNGPEVVIQFRVPQRLWQEELGRAKRENQDVSEPAITGSLLGPTASRGCVGDLSVGKRHHRRRRRHRR